MTDAEISLVVARIIYPECEWSLYDGDECPTCLGDDFDYTRNHCSWDMAVWLARQQRIVNEKHDGRADCMLKFQGLSLNIQAALGLMLSLPDASKLLAMSILEIGKNNGR